MVIIEDDTLPAAALDGVSMMVDASMSTSIM